MLRINPAEGLRGVDRQADFKGACIEIYQPACKYGAVLNQLRRDVVAIMPLDAAIADLFRELGQIDAKSLFIDAQNFRNDLYHLLILV